MWKRWSGPWTGRRRSFSVSSKMIQMYHPDLMDDAGDMYSVLGWAFQRGVGRPEGLYKKLPRVYGLCRRGDLPQGSV